MSRKVKPVRIQRKRVKGWRMPSNSVHVGRPSKWGNPFIVGRDGTLEQSIKSYYEWANNGKIPTIRRELKGKNLACWCKLSEPCHADILLKIANE